MATSTAPFPVIDGKYRMESEPAVRIGVVLPEDGKDQLDLEIPGGGYTLEVDGAPQPLASGALTLVREGNRVALAGTSGTVVRLLPPPDARPEKAGDGVLVRKVVAGRGFHWFKEIDQTLSDILECRVGGDHLVLVNEIPLETYLIGVITGEMSAECPIEFMKAQAVAARSWLLGQPKPPHPGQPFLWCNDDCCQRYQGTGGWSPRAVEAIRGCRGEVLITASNQYCDARYSKSTGGVSEDSASVWGSAIEGLEARLDAPEGSYAAKFYPVTEDKLVEYLTGDWLKTCDCYASPQVVPEETITRYLGRVDEPGTYFRWTVELSQESLRESLSTRAGIADLGDVLDLVPGRRGRSGRLEQVTVVYTTTDRQRREHVLTPEYNIRAGLWTRFLYSSAFLVEKEHEEDGRLAKATLRGAGWGHGAGLCQIGALGRALTGQDYRTILDAYYTNVRLEPIYT